MTFEYHGRSVAGPAELTRAIRADADAFVEHDPVWNWTIDFARQAPDAREWLDEALVELFRSALANPDEDLAIRQIDTYSLCAEFVSVSPVPVLSGALRPGGRDWSNLSVARILSALLRLRPDPAKIDPQVIGAIRQRGANPVAFGNALGLLIWVSPQQAAAFAMTAGPDVATGKDALVWRPMAALADSILSELAPFQQEIVEAFNKATPRARRRLKAALKDTTIIFGDLDAKERDRRDLIDHLDTG